MGTREGDREGWSVGCHDGDDVGLTEGRRCPVGLVDEGDRDGRPVGGVVGRATDVIEGVSEGMEDG